MSDSFLADQAVQQLDRVLGFFDRADSKASVLFAVNSGLLAVIALNLSAADFDNYILVALGGISALLIFASISFLYRGATPNLKGGAESLIYFSEIAKRTEADFIDEFLGQTKQDFTRDILGQVWRNSEILRIKFESVRVAFVLTAIALVPWCAFVGTVSVIHSQITLG